MVSSLLDFFHVFVSDMGYQVHLVVVVVVVVLVDEVNEVVVEEEVSEEGAVGVAVCTCGLLFPDFH